jgi:thiamine pyrophosphokinase
LHERAKTGIVFAVAGGDGASPSRGLLFIGGAGPDRVSLGVRREEVSLVVAADAGLLLALDVGIAADLVVGDMDSLTDRSVLDRFAPEQVLLFPQDKDETDTEIGLRVLRERGCADVTVAGGGGGRLDHLLAVAALFERESPPRRWVTDRADIRLIEGEFDAAGWEGSIVSFFPIGPQASGMRSEGLRWPLDGLCFRRGYGGISNRVTAGRMRVRVRTGKLLMVRTLGEVSR